MKIMPKHLCILYISYFKKLAFCIESNLRHNKKIAQKKQYICSKLYNSIFIFILELKLKFSKETEEKLNEEKSFEDFSKPEQIQLDKPEVKGMVPRKAFDIKMLGSF